MLRAPLPRRLALLVLPMLTASLAGCTHDGVGSALSLEDTVQPRARADVMALAPGRERAVTLARPAMVSLPGDAGAQGSVRTRDYADGLRQDIAMEGTRVPMVTNGITLLARTEGTNGSSLDRAPLQPPSEPIIRSEIGAALPHVTMQVVERERSNDYGPYGLALGRVGADTRCLYMWQWIDANRLPREGGLAGPASLRVRLCRADATFDEMAGWADHLRIDPAAAAVAGTDDARVLPPTALPEPVAAKPVRVRRVEHRGRHRLAERRRHDPADQALAAPSEAGPRYLTPDIAAPAAVRAQPVVASPSPAPAFGGDLPPEAFAGPRASIPSPRS